MIKEKRAFTLAETLITLVIIGVIAAITIPQIMIQHQKEQAIIQLKKVYSEFAQAAIMSRIVNSSYDSWDYSLSNTQFFRTYFYPYVTTSSKTIQQAQKEDIKYLQISGQQETSLLIMRAQGEIVELVNGCQIFTYPLDYTGTGSKYTRKCYAIDTNGYKKPNTFGKDLFMLCLDSELGVVPHAWDDGEPSNTPKTREKLKNSSSYKYNCNKKGRGMWCAALIMHDGWQMKKDYPW